MLSQGVYPITSEYVSTDFDVHKENGEGQGGAYVGMTEEGSVS